MMSHDSSLPLKAILIEAARNQALPRSLVNTVHNSEVVVVTPENAHEVGERFSMKLLLLREALTIVERRMSRLESDMWLGSVARDLGEMVVTLTTGTVEATDPVNVLRALHTSPELGIVPEFVSAVLGIHDERIGGDLERYSRHQVGTEYGQGGFMYQPSEIGDIWRLFAHLSFKAGSVFYDLGSGYGHSIFYGAALCPHVSFKGIEIMSGRVQECQTVVSRLGMLNITFETGDVSRGGFSDADIIFLFNPFPPDTLREVGRRIAEVAEVKPVVLLDYRGLVTETVSGISSIPFNKVAPYRLAASRRHFEESCALVGISTSGSSRK